MSATNRGAVREENDNYATPPWTIRRFLEAYPLDGTWLDPCAGNGSLIRAVSEFESKAGEPRTDWAAVDIDTKNIPGLDTLGIDYLITDFLERTDGILRKFSRPFRGVFTNPPYSLAEQFLRSLEGRGLEVIFLMRVGFLESAERNEYMQTRVPDLYVLPNRPVFKGKTSDSATYAWMVWPNDFGKIPRTKSSVCILPNTPKEERKTG